MSSPRRDPLRGGGEIWVGPAHRCHVLLRADIDSFLALGDFGARLTSNQSRAQVYDFVATNARATRKQTDVVSRSWQLHGASWLRLPVGAASSARGPPFQCSPEIYDYLPLPAGAVVVDFASRHVGGGCFTRGFVRGADGGSVH